MLQELDEDYRKCGDTPPQVPGWTTAAQAIAKIPSASDPNVHKVLESIRKSSVETEKKTLAAYRDATAQRHKLLGQMSAAWKDVRNLMARMQDAVSRALETTTRIDGYVEEYRAIRDDQERAARARAYSASKLFVVSVVVLAIALGGAFVNFQLIALPMAELVPAGARIGGVPVATVSALVIVLMEAAVGIFVMDMLGITELFPKLAGIPSSRRRLILWLGLAALFFLASVESSLAILREQIAEADSALKLALAGETGPDRERGQLLAHSRAGAGRARLRAAVGAGDGRGAARDAARQRPLRARRPRRDRAPRVRAAGARLRSHRRARERAARLAVRRVHRGAAPARELGPEPPPGRRRAACGARCSTPSAPRSASPGRAWRERARGARRLGDRGSPC